MQDISRINYPELDQPQVLNAHSPAEKKKLLSIPGADHNDILAVGLDKYMGAITDLVSSINPN
ncbi:MAG: hypothetical protein K9K64_13055 [Desulfohalobiaceae bacterium]|nr:hypothetical protein [Desulfohalobiaceae bacterium]